MEIRYIMSVLLIVHCVAAYGQAPVADTAAARKAKVAYVKRDTAVVSCYGGVPVFYHCKPMHKYRSMGQLTGSATVNYISHAFSKYAREARKYARCENIGIIIDDANFGVDSFEVVRFSPDDGRSDTALYTTPIFLSAHPAGVYEVIATIRSKTAWGSLNSNLARYYDEALDEHKPFDGIILDDVNYAFGKDDIRLFRWKR